MSPTDIVPGTDADEPGDSVPAEAAPRPEASGDVEGTESTSVVGASPVDTIAAERGDARADLTGSSDTGTGAAEPVGHPADAAVPPVLAEAVDVARAAAEDEAGPEQVGAHSGVHGEDVTAATHLFEAHQPGYTGWRWAVTVAVAGPGLPVTVSEVVLLPGPDALTAPEWVPWQQRVRAGDLGVGDLFPTSDDDPRLVAAYVQSDDPAVEDVAVELGLGRVRVLSRDGRTEAAERWHDSDFGPGSDMARSAPATCGTCGFYQPVAGSLRAAFGVCANDISPADGRVVHVEYGCGAHSEVEVEAAPVVAVAELVYDDAGLDYEAPLTAAEPTEDAASTETAPTDAASAEAGATDESADLPDAETAVLDDADSAAPADSAAAVSAPEADSAAPATQSVAADSIGDGATAPAADLVAEDPAKGDPAKGEPAKGDPAKGDPAKGDPAKGDPAKGDPAGGDLVGGAEPDAAVAEAAPTGVASDQVEVPVAEPAAGDAPAAGQIAADAAEPVSTGPDPMSGAETAVEPTDPGNPATAPESAAPADSAVSSEPTATQDSVAEHPATEFAATEQSDAPTTSGE